MRLKVCIHCFAEQPYLRKKWFTHNYNFCYRHKAAFEYIPLININNREILNWTYLQAYCKKRAAQKKTYLLGGYLSRLDGPAGDGIIFFGEFFEWRITLLRRYSLISQQAQKTISDIFFNIDSERHLPAIFKVLTQASELTPRRMFVLLYWAIVDPVLEFDRFRKKYPRPDDPEQPTDHYSQYATFYSSRLLLAMDIPHGALVYSPLKAPNKFKDLDCFDLGLGLATPLSIKMAQEEIYSSRNLITQQSK